MTLNCVLLPRRHNGPQDHLQLNHCVLVQWHFYLMCYRYAVLSDFKLLATSARKWSKHLTELPIVCFVTHNWQALCRSILKEIYSHLCLNDATFSEALIDTGPRPFILRSQAPQGGLDDIVNDALIATRVDIGGGKIIVYTVDAAYSQARWLEKCSTLIGSGTTAWALIWEPRGLDCHLFPDLQSVPIYMPF